MRKIVAGLLLWLLMSPAFAAGNNGPLMIQLYGSDIDNPSLFRSNIGLGALSTLGAGTGVSISGGNLNANVTSVFGRTGAVTLATGDVTGALGFTPLNKAGDTATGAMTFSASGTALTVTNRAAIGTVNLTGSSGYEISGTAVLNLFSLQASPVYDGLAGNVPDPTSVYIPAPITNGYAITAGTLSYAEMDTVNLTVSGTVTNHWGQKLSVVNILGTGTMSGELNQEAKFVVVPSGVTMSGGFEDLEVSLLNSGSVASWAGIVINPTNTSSGTLTGNLWGIHFTPSNQNATTSSVFNWIGLEFDAFTGGGAAPNNGRNLAILVNDPTQEITTEGKLTFRPQSTAPGISCNGTGTPTLDSRASDTSGEITTNTGATSCTLTFVIGHAFSTNPHMTITSNSGVTIASVTRTSTTFTFTFASSTGAVFTYFAPGTI